MAELEPFHEITLHEDKCEVHSVVGGFWTATSIHDYFDAVNEASIPLVKSRSPIYALVDFSDFVPQDRETAEEIRKHLITSQKFGLKKIAILSGSTLVKLQYRRLSQGFEVEFFDSKTEAVNWLRDHS